MNKNINTQIAIIGGGPGGYSAAFRAADLGKQVVLIEQGKNLGGVCLNTGCIPYKSLLYVAHVLNETKKSSDRGINFSLTEVDLLKLLSWRASTVDRLAANIKNMADQRKVELITGTGNFTSANQIEVIDEYGKSTLVNFQQAIIAVGAIPITLPFLPSDPRIMGPVEALNMPDIPDKLLVIGGGVVGLEMATIYNALGSKVTVVDITDQLLVGIDPDMIGPFLEYNCSRYKILLSTNITKIDPKENEILVTYERKRLPPVTETYNKICVAAGRKPNNLIISNNKLGFALDNDNNIALNAQKQTNLPHIFAIGDVSGRPMLAHKAAAEGKFVAEIIANLNPKLCLKNIAAVVYTDPQIATVGLTETEAQRLVTPYETSVFPWMASSGSLSLGRDEGETKLLFDPLTKKILGGSIVGSHAGELISKIAMMINLGASIGDISKIIYPHGTLSGTVTVMDNLFMA